MPSTEIVTNPEMLYIAIGIIGATVMPHNLYLHSSIVQTRAYERNDEGRREAIKWATTDSTIALMLALFINAAILIVAAATFHATGRTEVAEIGQAYELLSPLLGLGMASTLFAVALLASGLNSTVTATLAGQIVMEGFLHLRLPSWARRLLTRGIAIVPVVIVTAFYGERGTSQLLVFSQVILSMQLPFAVIPLVKFVSDRRKMGQFAISRSVAAVAWIVAAIIVALNVKLLVRDVLRVKLAAASSPGLTGRPSTPRLLEPITAVSGILDHPHARVMTGDASGLPAAQTSILTRSIDRINLSTKRGEQMARAATSKKPDTAIVLLEAAKKVLRQNGYSGFSTRDVAASAGVPLSQIHYHFGSKQGMVLALFEYLNAQLLDRQNALFGNTDAQAFGTMGPGVRLSR